ncbi:hypothetical protein Hanom_Chr12g01113381 [Helianthus anomalus]
MGHYPTRVISVSMGRYCKSGVVGIMSLPIIKKKQRQCSLVSQTVDHSSLATLYLLSVIIKTLVCKFSKSNAPKRLV